MNAVDHISPPLDATICKRKQHISLLFSINIIYIYRYIIVLCKYYYYMYVFSLEIHAKAIDKHGENYSIYMHLFGSLIVSVLVYHILEFRLF